MRIYTHFIYTHCKDQEVKLVCRQTIKEKSNGTLKEKRAKRWHYLDQINLLSKKFVVQKRKS